MLALTLAASLAPALGPVTDLDAFRAQVAQMVLSGASLPPDYLLSLSGLPDGQRMLAVIYLRRAGLLTGDAVPLGRIIPVNGDEQ